MYGSEKKNGNEEKHGTILKQWALLFCREERSGCKQKLEKKSGYK